MVPQSGHAYRSRPPRPTPTGLSRRCARGPRTGRPDGVARTGRPSGRHREVRALDTETMSALGGAREQGARLTVLRAALRAATIASGLVFGLSEARGQERQHGRVFVGAYVQRAGLAVEAADGGSGRDAVAPVPLLQFAHDIRPFRGAGRCPYLSPHTLTGHDRRLQTSHPGSRCLTRRTDWCTVDSHEGGMLSNEASQERSTAVPPAASARRALPAPGCRRAAPGRGDAGYIPGMRGTFPSFASSK